MPKQYNCITCNTTFQSTKGCKTRTPQYCSRICFSKRIIEPTTRQKQSKAKLGTTPHNKLPTKQIKCLQCETLIEIRIGARYQKKFCSMKCRNLAYKTNAYTYPTGQNSHRWKGGISTENELQRKSAQYKTWRTNVFKRDNYQCQHCGQIGGELQADHIKPFAYFKELRFDINNGQTLCKQCHQATDTFGSKAIKYDVQ